MAPPSIRLANQSVMRSSWRDPTDLTPNARRTAKEITGFRATCPLRQMQHRCIDASSITNSHILAADRLRLDADAVAIGLSNDRDLAAAQAWTYGPIAGPSALALRNIRAWPRFRAAMALFDPAQRRLLTHVVLLNRSVASWCAQLREAGQTVKAGREQHRLVVILDVLVEHYDIDEDREARVA